MLILISDANILIDMHDDSLIEAMFRLSYRFATPDVIYVEELQGRHAYLNVHPTSSTGHAFETS